MSECDRNNDGDMRRATFGHHEAEIWRSNESPINNKPDSVWYCKHSGGPRRRGQAAVSSGGFRHKLVLSSSMVTGERPG